MLDTLAGAKWFSTMNLNSGYWQMPLYTEKEETASSTGQRLYSFKVVLFDVSKAPAIFDRPWETVLSGLTNESCPTYQDIIVIGRTFREHLDILQRALQRIRQSHLIFNPAGHNVMSEGVIADTEKMSAVREWPH
jgi:hypothetical protein